MYFCSFTFLGTLVPLEKKEINRRKPTVRETQAQIKKPDNVVTVEKEEESAEQTVKMNKIISKYYKTYHKPLDFFKLVLNPDDFGKTIQNILQISFLIRDGRVIITKGNISPDNYKKVVICILNVILLTDASGVLVVQPCSKDKTTQAKAGKRPNIQNVMYLNMEQWKVTLQLHICN